MKEKNKGKRMMKKKEKQDRMWIKKMNKQHGQRKYNKG